MQCNSCTAGSTATSEEEKADMVGRYQRRLARVPHHIILWLRAVCEGSGDGNRCILEWIWFLFLAGFDLETTLMPLGSARCQRRVQSVDQVISNYLGFGNLRGNHNIREEH